MAQLILTIPDEAVSRVLEAFGKLQAPVDGAGRVNATAEEVRQDLLQYIRSRVDAYETQKEQQLARNARTKLPLS